MMNLTIEICNSFNKQAPNYEKAAKVQQEIGERLFERLAYFKISPRYVLDLGCGAGFFTSLLKKHYPQATVIGLDIAYSMLKQAKKKQHWWRKWPLINADMLSLPFANGSFDLIFANQVIHWSPSLALVIRELNRVMNQEGCLMFSTLGPDTFKELKKAWQAVHHYAHANDFVDMHDIGDCLLSESFLDPVVDMELLTVHYPDLKKLIQNLKAQGVRNINRARSNGLIGKKAWQTFNNAYAQLKTAEEKYPLSYEVVYGHAWKGNQTLTQAGIETFIPISSIKRER